MASWRKGHLTQQRCPVRVGPTRAAFTVGAASLLRCSWFCKTPQHHLTHVAQAAGLAAVMTQTSEKWVHSYNLRLASLLILQTLLSAMFVLCKDNSEDPALPWDAKVAPTLTVRMRLSFLLGWPSTSTAAIFKAAVTPSVLRVG